VLELSSPVDISSMNKAFAGPVDISPTNTAIIEVKRKLKP